MGNKLLQSIDNALRYAQLVGDMPQSMIDSLIINIALLELLDNYDCTYEDKKSINRVLSCILDSCSISRDYKPMNCRC